MHDQVINVQIHTRAHYDDVLWYRCFSDAHLLETDWSLCLDRLTLKRCCSDNLLWYLEARAGLGRGLALCGGTFLNYILHVFLALVLGLNLPSKASLFSSCCEETRNGSRRYLAEL